MVEDWRPLIIRLVQIKQAIFEADKMKLWQFHLPKVGASEKELSDLEKTLGIALDPEYRRFLTYANGWQAFYQSVDLFGTAELRGGDLMKGANLILKEIPKEVLEKSGCSKASMFPIAATPVDLDVFVLQASRSKLCQPVVWFAGGEIDRFGTFGEFFASMIEYSLRELQALSAG